MAIPYDTHMIVGGSVTLVACLMMGYYIARQVEKDKLDKKQLRLFGIFSAILWLFAILTTKISYFIKVWMVDVGIITTRWFVRDVVRMSNSFIERLLVIDFGFMTLLPGFFIGAILLLIIFRRYRDDIGRCLDYWLVGGALFMFIYRIQCFLHGCCHGLYTAVPWGIAYEGTSKALMASLTELPRHPVQLYESLGFLVIFLVLYEFNRRKKYNGQTALWFLVLSCSFRFFIEFFRWKPFRFILRQRIGDTVHYMSITWGQIISAVIVLLAVAMLVYMHFRKKKK